MLARPTADGPPLGPSSDQARQWLERELAHAEYHQGNTFLDRIAEWFANLFNRSTELPATPNPVSVVVTVALAVVVVALLAWVLPRIRRERRAPSGPGAVLSDPTLNAADYRDRARRALAEGRADAALLDAFRALTKAATDRTLLDEAPGQTAHEVGLALTDPFPQHTADLTRAADLFDAVRYGDTHVDREAAQWMQWLDEQLAGTRPRRPGAGDGTAPGAGGADPVTGQPADVAPPRGPR
ncbi:MAG TPA: DUF4129 domain-containing protein [Segeticoccus sp.]|uniref:DUF4129 domain-containing protein n=1 Tax=Segeticoccus sp. TaxID=2706531 RepID=UPI002D7F7444|nr:DUF4129 domain-containing protein [Segeticoccus sp.]HET8602187.1 DUF4129 domain-containing protein [Segeticoccus sp.]